MAPSVGRPTSAQVMILQFMNSNPALGSGLTARGLEPALDSVSPSLLTLPQLHSVSLSLSKINIRSTLVAQWVERPTSAQVMISWSVSSSPVWGSVLTAQSL